MLRGQLRFPISPLPNSPRVKRWGVRAIAQNFLVAWRQLSYHRIKLAVAAAGVVVAVMLMLVQLGIRQGALDNSLAFVRLIQSELVACSPRTETIFEPSQIPRVLLYRVLAHPEVQSLRLVYIGRAHFRNPWNRWEYPIAVYGVDLAKPLLRLPGISEEQDKYRLGDHAAFDSMSRQNFGPIAEYIKQNGELITEVNRRRIHVVDAMPVGISISTDGNMYVSHANFLRLFPDRKSGAVDLGLIKLVPGADVEKVRRELAPLLKEECKLRTQTQLLADEDRYIRSNHPIDFIFGMGATVGFFIGFVVVYQILYTEVTNHLPQFATMKAMGFTDGYLLQLVLWQSGILAVLGYIPGFFLALGLYEVATRAIQMPFAMTWSRGVSIFLLTLLMCGISGAVAVRKAWTADPAEVF